MELWRFAVTSYLWKAHRDGLLQQSSLPEEFNDVILEQVRPDWIIHITRRMSKEHFLKICRTLYSPASHLPEEYSPSNGAGSRLHGQRHTNENLRGSPQHAGRVCCHSLATCAGPVPALHAVLWSSGATDEEADLICSVCATWPAATTQATETALG